MKRSFNHLCSFLEKSNLYFPAQDCFSFVCNLTLDERQWKIWVDSKERWLLDEENVLLSLDSRNENDSNQGVVLKTQDIDRETRIFFTETWFMKCNNRSRKRGSEAMTRWDQEDDSGRRTFHGSLHKEFQDERDTSYLIRDEKAREKGWNQKVIHHLSSCFQR